MTTAERWMVVDRHRNPVITGMYRRENAQMEADELNRTGIEDGRPYRVVTDIVTMSMEEGS